jgi:hypothetical protein
VNQGRHSEERGKEEEEEKEEGEGGGEEVEEEEAERVTMAGKEEKEEIKKDKGKEDNVSEPVMAKTSASVEQSMASLALSGGSTGESSAFSPQLGATDETPEQVSTQPKSTSDRLAVSYRSD